MLTISQIKESIKEVVVKYPIKKLSLFGSYAHGIAKEDSDLDLLIEFSSPNVSLFMLSEIKNDLEFKLNKEIDLIHAPIEDNSIIIIDEVIDIYEQ